MKRNYCYTCGAPVIHMQVVYGYDEYTGKELIHRWVECSVKPKWWTKFISYYHPATSEIRYYFGL